MGRGGIGRLLRRKYNILSVETPDAVDGLTPYFQHAEYRHWKNWGDFTSSFAILRDPNERCRSAIKQAYKPHQRNLHIEDFKNEWFTKLRSDLPNDLSLAGGHFIPQISYIGPETELYLYEHDWLEALGARYEFSNRDQKRVNRSPNVEFAFTDEEENWIRTFYAMDYNFIDERFY